MHLRPAMITVGMRLFASIFVLAAGASQLSAQGVTTSAVGGTVTSSDAQGLVSARVVVTHVGTGRTAEALTRTDGRYLIQGLQPGGPYTIAVSGIGYASEERSGINLVLSQTLRLDFQLTPQAVELGTLTGNAERGAVISKGRTGTATTVSDSLISRLPTITRDFTDFTRLTPQISTAGSGTSAGGRNNRFNNVQIDGAVNNDLFGIPASGTPGGQAGTKPITLEAIQEFQVVLAPFDVRQGGFTGAGINAITRSGTNQFRGTLAYFLRNEGLVGKYIDYADVTSPKFGDFKESAGAFSIGGPIMKDRLHFFVAGELSSRKAPNAGPAIGRDALYTEGEVQPIVDYVRTTYGYDVGEIGELQLERNSDNLFGRVDFTINPNHRLTLRHNFIDAGDDNFTRANNSYFLGSAIYTFASKTNSSVAQLNSTFNNRFFNEFRVGYSTVRDQRKVPDPFPFVQIDLPSGPAGARQVSFGAENFSVANALDQNVLEITNDLSWSVGRHSLTVGTHNELADFSNLFARNIYGLYQFASFAAFQAGTPRRYEYSYLNAGGKVRPLFNTRQLSLYGQDQFDFSDRITLTAGVRVDVNQLPDSPTDNPIVTQSLTAQGAPPRSTSDVPTGDVLINPRIGFNWDVQGDRSLQVRGGLGLFSGRTPYVWISNGYGNTGLDYTRFTCSSAATAPRFTPNLDAQPRNCTGTTSPAPNEINLIDPDLRFPQVFRTSLAVDRKLPFGFVGTLEGLYTKALNDVLFRELTIKGPSATVVEGRTRQDRLAVPFSNITDVTNTNENYSYNLTGQLQRSFLNAWSGSVAYTFSRSKDVTSTASSQAFSNWRFNPIRNDPNDPELTRSNFDVPHRIVASGSYRLELFRNFATDLSMIYVGESGQPYSFTYFQSDVNNDGSNGNDLIYVPRDASEILFQNQTGTTPITPAQSFTNFDAFIDSVDCLKDARGSVIERNACRTPWANRFDFRLAQTVPTLGTQNLEITLDVINFGNLLNKKWGLSQFVTNQNDTPLQAASTTPGANGRILMRAFAPRTTLYQISNESSRYRLQLGARYSF
ncbi:MAG: TonB-dependent receptor [Longimicrobiales bacterium]